MTTAKRGGRRPLDPDDPSVYVGVTLPSKQVDALRERAEREHVTIQEVIRRVLAKRAEERKK